MESLLRDINRESGKMKTDTDNLFRHYEKLASYVQQYVEQATIEWAQLILDHPKALLLIVETTPIVDERGIAYSSQSEPIRLTGLSLASGEIWDQLLHPKHSKDVLGQEYHGLTMADVQEKPIIDEVWLSLQERLEHRHLIIFGAEWARLAMQPAMRTLLLDGACCLHNKCREYYNEFYGLGLEKILSYQYINKKRSELKDSRDRILVLADVIRNLAAGMEKQLLPVEDSFNDLDDQPF